MLLWQPVNQKRKIRNFNQKIKSFHNLDDKWVLFCSGCECNGHSDACVYDIKKDYGVCINCQHNTRGDKCDTCRPGYYRNATKLITSASVCICKCCLYCFYYNFFWPYFLISSAFYRLEGSRVRVTVIFFLPSIFVIAYENWNRLCKHILSVTSWQLQVCLVYVTF